MKANLTQLRRTPFDRNHPREVKRREVQDAQFGDHSETIRAQDEFWAKQRSDTESMAKVAADIEASVESDEVKIYRLDTDFLMESDAYLGNVPGGFGSAEARYAHDEVDRRMSILHPGEVEIDRMPSSGHGLHPVGDPSEGTEE